MQLLLFSSTIHFFSFLYQFSFSNSLSASYITKEVKTVILSNFSLYHKGRESYCKSEVETFEEGLNGGAHLSVVG